MKGETIIVVLITNVLTFLTTRTEKDYDLKATEKESDSTTESIYIQNMEVILKEYKQQVSSFREEVQSLKEDNRKIKEEFEWFRKKNEQVVDDYKKYVDLLEDENKELKEVVVDLEVEIQTLKEGE